MSKKNASPPIAVNATSEKGASDSLSFSHPTTLTEENATSTYRIMLMKMARIRALGIFYSGSFVSSENFTIPSNPI